MSGKSNPFKSVWNYFTIITGIIGLSSLLDDLIAWQGFIEKFIAYYRGLVYPFFDFLFSWLPFTVPAYVNDYLVIGALVASSYFKTLSSLDEIKGYGSYLIPIGFEFRAFTYRFLGWPIVLGYYVLRLKKDFNETRSIENWEKYFKNNPPKNEEDIEKKIKVMVLYDYANHMEPRKFFQWFGAILIGCFLLVIVNQVI